MSVTPTKNTSTLLSQPAPQQPRKPTTISSAPIATKIHNEA